MPQAVSPNVNPAASAVTFDSFFMGGFECSSHRRKDGVRLDLVRATGHDSHAERDYRGCANLGLRTVRDGLRWHLIEKAPGVYDWSSWAPMIEAANVASVQVIWDVFHYGTPDYLDQGGKELIERYADFAAEAVRLHRAISGKPALVCPINEISFFAWAVEVGYFPPAGPRRRGWFKRHLVKAAVQGIRAMRQADPECRFIWAEPLIHIAPRDRSRAEMRAAEKVRQGQFEAYDMLMGRVEPQLGGSEDLIDVIGLNFYPHNQWYLHGPTIPMGHHEYRALSEMLVEVAQRYRQPMYIAETGAEGSGGPAWLHYVCDEVRDAVSQGAPVEGICLYPITAYPGWDNSRHAEVGLFSVIHADGSRRTRQPMADELARQQRLFEKHSRSTQPCMPE
ncbi:beta-glucosidase [Mesorhizobium sp. WSM3864]|uniref:beta-glucosidase n=1 Tax=Mesorhizobium sp. WSM3864 TaxID=2029404 RepID=UPI000BAEA375|nr:beta-glucosidase [Mesorhizobium sp. WSM3864]PBB90366.1 beta-glucosidase [Mesorhizobium sp. WSM3864]